MYKVNLEFMTMFGAETTLTMFSSQKLKLNQNISNVWFRKWK